MDNEHRIFISKMLSIMDEKTSRIFLGGYCTLPECGSILELNAYTKKSRNTIAKGKGEYDSLDPDNVNLKAMKSPVGIREPGGGRKNMFETDPLLIAALYEVLSGYQLGGAQSMMHWSTLSLRQLQDRLNKKGVSLSHISIGKMLDSMDARLRNGPSNILSDNDRKIYDEQYTFINNGVYKCLKSDIPVLSIMLDGDTDSKYLPCNLEVLLVGLLRTWLDEMKPLYYRHATGVMIIIDCSTPLFIRTAVQKITTSKIFNQNFRPLVSMLPPGRTIWHCNLTKIREYHIEDKENNKALTIRLSLITHPKYSASADEHPQEHSQVTVFAGPQSVAGCQPIPNIFNMAPEPAEWNFILP